MQRPGALLDPVARGLERVVGVDRLVLEAPLAEPHGAPAGDVDRGIEDHDAATWAQTPVKFASRRRPASDDFSGWNCTP